MNLHILQLPKLIAQRRGTAILGLTIIVMLWAGIITKYFESTENDEREAERANQNFAMLFEENVLRSIGEIDKSLLYLRRTVETRKASDDYHSIHSIVQSTDVLSEIIVQAAIVDSKGIIRWSNARTESAPAISVADREHIKVQLNSTEDHLYISKPVIGRASGHWSVQFTRRFLNNDGTIGGVVVASLNPVHFTSFYDKFDLGSSGAISMIGSDGVVRASGGNAVGRYALGQDINGTKLAQHMQANGGATFEDEDPSTGEARLVTVRKVRGHPLWVSVSIRKADIFQRSWANLRLHANRRNSSDPVDPRRDGADPSNRSEGQAKSRSAATDPGKHEPGHHAGHQGLADSDHQHPMRRTAGFAARVRRASAPVRPAGGVSRPGPAIREHGNRQTPRSSPSSADFTVSERKMPNGTVIEVRSGHLPDGSFVQTFTDITKRREAEAHVARLASEDPLTGLPNRRVFRATLDEVSRRQRTSRERRKEAGGICRPVPRSRSLQGGQRHARPSGRRSVPAGRRQAAEGGRCRKPRCLRGWAATNSQSWCRTVESRAALEALANRLTEVVSQPYEIDGHRILSSVSIGIAIGPQDGDNSDDLLMAADLALYAVKANGRGTHRFYQKSMNEELNDRRQIEMDLREAIDQNQLELHYQPIIDLQRNVITGFEALARWRHPVKGMVPPVVFIPVAEDSGLILPLGAWALRGGLQQCREMAERSQDRRQSLAGAVFDTQSVRTSSSRPCAKPAWRRSASSSKSPSGFSWTTARRRCRPCTG